jgi:hypothetical protein
MCRNITPLRGLVPAATNVEIEAAARQYARKVSALTTKTGMDHPAFDAAVAKIAAATAELLSALPARRQPPPIDPPLRRIAERTTGQG